MRSRTLTRLPPGSSDPSPPEVGASYSTVAASARRRGVLPLEVSYLHAVTAAASGGAVPYVTSDQLTLRVYVRLLGR